MGKKKHRNKVKTSNKMTSIYLSIIILNINGPHAPTKRHRVVELIQKQNSDICCLQETHWRSKEKHRLEVKLWKKIFHAKDASFHKNKKKYEISILTSDKIDCKAKAVIRNKEEYYIIING